MGEAMGLKVWNFSVSRASQRTFLRRFHGVTLVGNEVLSSLDVCLCILLQEIALEIWKGAEH
jgi:hypothetical protein